MVKSQFKLEELMTQLQEALASDEGGHALYLLVSALEGTNLGEEFPICDPAGRPIGYIVPAKERYALHTTAEYRAMQEDGRTLGSGDAKSGWSR